MFDTLQQRLGEKVSVNPYALASHGRDENATPGVPPLAVVYAESITDVLETVAWARETRTPVIAFGAGTSFEGHVVPQGPAISLDLSRMHRVLHIQPEDFAAEVEPGLTRIALNTALRSTGLFFPVDPGADASLGGMTATNASGTTTIKYGSMRRNILAMEVVLANGDVLQLGRPVQKTSSGYDLKDLFVGSGGTLGIITRLTLKLHPVPEHVHTLRVIFPDLRAAVQAAAAITASALPVARLELLDELALQTINAALGRQYPEQPALFLEFHSSTEASVAAEAELAEELVNESGALAIDRARTAAERDALWEARHKAYPSLVSRFPGHRYMITDTAVPLSRIVELVTHAQDLLREMQLPGSIIGHVGDGNFHTTIATPPDQYARAYEYSERLVTHALNLGGTATGEHGIGIVKRHFLAEEHGVALDWMRRVKALFDPDNLLNPGKDL